MLLSILLLMLSLLDIVSPVWAWDDGCCRGGIDISLVAASGFVRSRACRMGIAASRIGALLDSQIAQDSMLEKGKQGHQSANSCEKS